MKSKRWLGVALSVSVGVLGSCSKQEKEPEPVVTVQVATAQKAPIQQVVTTEAVLFPKNQAAITPKVTAPVREFLVNRGARVHKGQLLAVLENADIAASVLENKGALEQAQAVYETTTRASLPEDLSKAELDAKSAREAYDAAQKLYDSRQDLFKQGALPRKDLDAAAVALVQAKSQSQLADQHLAAMHSVGKEQTARSAAGQLASAKGKFEGAAAQMRYTEIRSPIDGYVTDRPNFAGEMPAQGIALVTVMDTSVVVARAHIPQDQAVQLKVGTVATITAEGQEYPGRVTIVSPALDPGSTTVEVWVEAPNKSGTLKPGSTVQVQIVAQTVKNAITIPASALLKSPEGATTVMLVGKDARAHQAEVEVGVRNSDQVQITKGLSEGQSVVTTGAYGLPDNTQIKVAAAEEKKPAAGEKD